MHVALYFCVYRYTPIVGLERDIIQSDVERTALMLQVQEGI